MNEPVQSAALAAIQEVSSDLYKKSGAAAFGISGPDFAQVLAEIARKHLPSQTSPAETRTFCLTLRVEEIALARACAAGNEKAWEVFLTRYREKLYLTGMQIAREDSAARELADSLYADLYGLGGKDGVRVSKLVSYTGRGSLEGWLRTVMAQEHVNRYRRTKRLVSLDEESEDGTQFAAPAAEPMSSVDPRLADATDEALADLSPEDRFVLASYYLDGRTLADIARTLRVHESTISRKMDKLAKSLRKEIVAGLARRGMSRRQATEELEVDVRDLQVNIRARLAQESGDKAFSDQGGLIEKKVRAPAGEPPG
jgi:RNA polymerase sigma-70 factor (ECF subfamily)